MIKVNFSIYQSYIVPLVNKICEKGFWGLMYLDVQTGSELFFENRIRNPGLNIQIYNPSKLIAIEVYDFNIYWHKNLMRNENAYPKTKNVT